jgi:hypothetical protein
MTVNKYNIIRDFINDYNERVITPGHCIACNTQTAKWREVNNHIRAFCHIDCQSIFHRMLSLSNPNKGKGKGIASSRQIFQKKDISTIISLFSNTL